MVRETRASDALLRALVAAAELLVPLVIAGLLAITTHPLVNYTPTFGSIMAMVLPVLLSLVQA